MMKKLGVLFLFFCCVTIFTGCNVEIEKTEQKETSIAEEEIQYTAKPINESVEENGMEISITYGYENTVKADRYVAVYVDVNNTGEDFKGSLQMFVEKGENEDILYQKDVFIGSGEKKQLYLTYCETQKKVKNLIRFVNEKEEVVVKKNFEIKTIIDKKTAFWGILTDDTNNIGYLGDKTSKVFYLTEKTLGQDDQCLDTLDIIVINDFDSERLSQQQRVAIADWVNKGGTLVIGTGENKNRTLLPLKKELRIKNLDDLSKKESDADTSNGKTVGYGNDGKTMQVLKMGLGVVQVFPVDLNLEYGQWNTQGSIINTSIWYNISTDQKKELTVDSLQEDYVQVYQGITAYGTDKTPFVEGYAIILLVYLFLIGPLLYILLKKMDKRSLTWIIIPVLALAFSYGIYFLGGETRVTKPYMGYLSFFHLDGQGKGSGVEETYFSITVPSNKKYNVTIPDEYAVTADYNSNTYFSYPVVEDVSGENKEEETLDSAKQRSKTAVKIRDNYTEIEMKNYQAFTTGYYRSNIYKEEDGTYDYNISNFGDEITGEFTNRLGYDLENVTIFSNHNLVMVGDIVDGQTGRVGGGHTYQIISKESIYNDELIKALVGDYNMIAKNGEMRRKYYSYCYCFDTNYERIKNGSYLIGFVDDDDENKAGIQGVQLKQTGMRVVLIPLDVNYTKGKTTYISNIETYINSIVEGGYDTGYRDLSAKDTIIEYQFDQNDKIKALYYREDLNPEINQDSNDTTAGFHGSIYAYNFDTGKYDVIFVSGVKGELTALDSYIDTNKKMLIKYEADGYGEIRELLPILSVEKEAE